MVWAAAAGLLVSCGSPEQAADGAGDDSESGGGTAMPTGADDGMVDDTTASPDDGPDDGPEDDPDDDATTSPPAECGNGMVEGLEQCDDANDINGDGCDNDCTETFDTSIWQVTQGGDAAVREAGQGVAVDANDDIVVVGYIVHEVNNPNIFVRKLDSDGEEIWTVEQDLSMGGEDRAYAVAVDPDGNYAVAGDTDTAPASSDIWIEVMGPDGGAIWSTTVDGPGGGNDGGRAVAFDADGNLGVAGLVRAGDNDNDIWVAMYDPAGVQLWSDIIAGPEGLDDRGRGVVFDPDGNLLVAGFLSNGSFNRDVWLRKYDPDGGEIWTESWDSDNSADDAAFAIAASAGGDAVVAGISPVLATNQDFWLGRFDPDGGLAWWKRFGGPAITNDNALGVAVDSMDFAVAVGFKGLTNTDTDIWLTRYDATGLQIWTQTVFGAGLDSDEARAVAIDSADNIIVTGEIRDAKNNDGDIWLGKFAPQ